MTVTSPPGQFTVALAGNPNVGKTSLFNRLTGLHQHVGNWPGKTVARRDGEWRAGEGAPIRVTDLPGIYSLSTHTLEEAVTRQFLLAQPPDLILNVVDATHLERNLYLTTQLLELERPVVVVLTMVDAAAREGRPVDAGRLAQVMGVPVVPVVPTTGQGLAALEQLVRRAVRGELQPWRSRFRFRGPAGHLIARVVAQLPSVALPGPSVRWVAARLVEDDPDTTRWAQAHLGPEWATLRAHITATLPEAPVWMADARYGWIREVLTRAGLHDEGSGPVLTWQDRLDTVLTRPGPGMVLSLLLLALGILGLFSASATLQGWIEEAFTALGMAAGAWVQRVAQAPGWAVALVRDGLFSGIGTVASFAPLIAGFFLFLGLLEDSGYVARAAFVFDRVLGRFGLRGKAGIGILVGLGCNVPSAMAARTASTLNDRLAGAVLSPLVICSARLVVLGFIAGALFSPAAATAVVAAIYGISVVLVLGFSLLLRRTLLPAPEDDPFVIELPPFRRPTLANVGLYAWEHTWHFLQRALTVIAPMTLVVWALAYFPDGRVDESLLAWLGRMLEPLFGRWIGLDWRLLVSLFTGFLAKEGTLSTLAVLYGGAGAGGAALAEHLRQALTLPQALSFLMFFAFYSPCLAAAVTIRQETGSTRWALFTIGYSLVTATVLAWITYHVALGVVGSP